MIGYYYSNQIKKKKGRLVKEQKKRSKQMIKTLVNLNFKQSLKKHQTLTALISQKNHESKKNRSVEGSVFHQNRILTMTFSKNPYQTNKKSRRLRQKSKKRSQMKSP